MKPILQLTLRAFAAATLMPFGAFAQTLPVWDTGHLDIYFNYTAGGWDVGLHHDDYGSTATDGAILHARDGDWPNGSRASRPSGAAWDFTGVAENESFWYFPMVQEQGILWPGFSTEGTTASLLAEYSIDDSRVSASPAAWMPIQLMDVRYSGPAEEGHLSMWTTGIFGGADVWMSIVDGISDDDVWLQLARGHSHMNWGFSAPGFYEVDLQASAFLAGSMEQIFSDVYTVQFGVGVIPEPAHVGIGLGAGVLALAGLRRRFGKKAALANV